jgi:hypothetical protein
MSYLLSLTDAELATLEWAVNHGYFPEETYQGMIPVGSAEDPGEYVYEVNEHAAWAILEWRDSNADLYACIGQPLLGKLLKLEEEIV